MATTIERAVELVNELQEWLEDRDGLSSIPGAHLRYSQTIIQIGIGEETLWVSEIDDSDEMTLEFCKAKWLEYVASLQPFFAEATAAE